MCQTQLRRDEETCNTQLGRDRKTRFTQNLGVVEGYMSHTI